MKHTGIQWPESLIIAFSDAFLTRGIHYVPVNSHKEVRELLLPFLSLYYYSTLAYVSLIEQQLPNQDIINLSGIFNTYKTEDLEEYLLNSFYYEFLWIELSPFLCHKQWYPLFAQKITDFNLPTRIPIIIFILPAHAH